MGFLIGLDIGTSNIKGSIYSTEGEYLGTSSISYSSYSPKNNFHEQDPDDWTGGILEVLSCLLCKNEYRENLLSVSISTQGGTVVPVDNDFKPLTNAITWMDRRGLECFNDDAGLQAKNIDFYQRTGWRLDSCISFLPLWWLKKNQKDVFDKISKILFVNDYILKKLTGKNIQDPSNASISLFYNIKEGKWDAYILGLMGLDENKFSKVEYSGKFVGYLDQDLCKKLGIKNRVKVINGGHDQYCAGIGAGILDEKDMLLATGTAWVIFKMIGKPLLDPKYFFSIGRNILKDKFGLIYVIPSAGASLKWFAINLMDLEKESMLYDIIDKNIDRLRDIKNNILFLPYLTGAQGPDFDMNKKAFFNNVETGHDHLDFIKAIMEGVAFQLKKILIKLQEKKIDTEKIKMVGGGARNDLWTRIVSDIMGKDVLIPENTDEDFAVRGAAILAGYGAGVFSSLKEGHEKLRTNYKVINPDLNNKEFYNNKFDLIRML